MGRRFGQHFLRSPAVIKKIIAAAAPQPGERFLEIGPGDGALTAELIKSGANITAVEIDGELAAKLAARLGEKTGKQAEIINADALTCNWRELLRAGDKIIGNLPYNISAPLLLRIMDTADLWRDCHIMVQKEVGERLCAAPGGAEYGRLTVRGRWAFLATQLFTVPPAAFSPPPKVFSAVCSLSPRPAQIPTAADALLRDAFGQRRKTLRNSLAKWNIDWEQAGIDGERRAQTVSPEEFLQLAKIAKIAKSDGGGAGGDKMAE